MKKGLILPALAAALVVGACEDDGDPIVTTTQANVRFVNAVSGVNANLAFTASGNMVGSPLAFGQANTQCVRINSGNAVPLAFGTANTGGTGIQGSALTTMNQNLTGGGNFTVIAAGTQTDPRLLFLNNTFSGNLGTNQAAVRFVNLVPNTNTTTILFDVFTGTGTTPTTSALGFGGTGTAFSTVNAGSTTFNFRNPGSTTNLDLAGTNTITLQPGTVNTIGILPDVSGTSFRAMNITGC